MFIFVGHADCGVYTFDRSKFLQVADRMAMELSCFFVRELPSSVLAAKVSFQTNLILFSTSHGKHQPYKQFHESGRRRWKFDSTTACLRKPIKFKRFSPVKSTWLPYLTKIFSVCLLICLFVLLRQEYNK